MSICRARCVVLCLLATGAAAAKDRPGFDVGATGALDGVPVHLVVVNDRLRLQMAWLHASAFPLARDQVQLRLETAGYDAQIADLHRRQMPLAPDRQGPLIVRQMLEPARAVLASNQCLVPGGEPLAEAVEATVRGTAWGGNASLLRHGPLAPGQAEAGPHYEIELSYSLAPDVTALVTVVRARLYAPGLKLVPGDWRRNPAWSDEIVVVSDRIAPPAKTPADIEATIARENARFAAIEPKRLARRAYGGDMQAVEDLALGKRWHERRLEEAGWRQWTLLDATLPLAQQWSEGGCAPLHAAIRANATEAARVLGEVFAGKTQALAPDWVPSARPSLEHRAQDRNLGQDGVAENGRRLYADRENVVVSRRAGDNVVVDFRYSWDE